jgi:hypothetical protein
VYSNLNKRLPANEGFAVTMLASHFLAHSIKVLKFQTVIQLWSIFVRSSRDSFSSPLKDNEDLS